MNAKTRGKSSSRSGRFKKKLVTPADLSLEAPLIEAKMAPILPLFEARKISPAEFTALYLLTILSHRYPKQWLGARRPSMGIQHQLNLSVCNLRDLGLTFEPNIDERLLGVNSLGDLFNHFALKSTPETVNRSVLNWSNGSYGLELMFRIPESLEVLAQQKVGRRCVSVLTKAEKTKNYILGERDALSFTMHDLIHADHFYFHPESHEGQLGFYSLMDFCLRNNHFSELLGNKKFSAELDYLISDMNAYAIHLLKCFKAALFHYHQQGDKFFNEWLLKISASDEVKNAFLALNTKNHEPEVQDSVLLEFLSRWKRQTP